MTERADRMFAFWMGVLMVQGTLAIGSSFFSIQFPALQSVAVGTVIGFVAWFLLGGVILGISLIRKGLFRE